MMRGSSVDPARDSGVLILDSWPVMEWLKERQPVAQRFRSLLMSARTNGLKLMMSNLNLGEVFYNTWIEWDQHRAESTLDRFSTLPIQIVHPNEREVLAAARVKALYNCSYADAFAVVLAIETQAPVVTGDKDFLRVRDGGLIDVEWWGA